MVRHSCLPDRVGNYLAIVRPEWQHSQILGHNLRDNAFGLCYAAPVASFAIPGDAYILTLRLEGDGQVSRSKFKVYQDPATLMLTMSEVSG